MNSLGFLALNSIVRGRAGQGCISMGFKFTFFCELDLNFATGMKVILGCHPVKAFVVAP